MKSAISKLISLAVIACILTGCPYTSTVPIDKPNVKVNKKLTGKWVKTSDLSNENPEYYEIKKYDKYRYEIIKNTYNSNDSIYKQESYITHITEIDNNSFLNMQKGGTGEYFLHKIDLVDKEFTLYEITNNIDEKFSSSEPLREFVKKNMNLSFFYNQEEVKYSKQ